MDNECRKTCTSMKKTISRQFIIVIKIIIIVSVVHFPNELNQKRSQYPNCSCHYKLPEFNLSLNLFPAFHTMFYSLVPQNLQNLPLSLPKFLCVTSIYTQPIRSYLKQTNFNLLSKQCNLHLNLSHSVGGLCLLCKQPISNYALSFNC